MNEILSDRSLWDVSARPVAAKRFDPLVVDIFYDQIVPEELDAFGLRESYIPLPSSSSNSDYRRVQLLGTTGSGKTTLVRQCLGTNPDTERFPSTSTAKTTVADTEVLLDQGAYRAVVTFFPRDMVRDHVEECILAAALSAYKGEPERVVMRRLLNHVDQRFRFNYLLGNGGDVVVDDSDEDELFEAENEPAVDLEGTNAFLNRAANTLRTVATQYAMRLRQDLSATGDDERVVEELFEENLDDLLREDDDIQSIADEYMEQIEQRFDALTFGSVEKTKQGWPRVWSLESEPTRRAEFIRAVSRFSSNYAPHFGTLLTPLVNGVRVAGPFMPVWSEEQPKLVLFDGEGLGHTPDSSASIPTTLTRRFDEVDAILLVDNAAQPMQAAPLAVARHLAATGKGAKLLMCFTHFDLVKGANLQGVQDKQDHVLASVEKALSFVGSELGPFAERILRKRLHAGCFFVGGIDQILNDGSKKTQRTIGQLRELFVAIDRIVERPALVAAKPAYDRMNLVLAVKKAVENFHSAWEARLGRSSKPGISKEHWTRVKALTRRFAENWSDEYDTLRPVADLHKELYEAVYVFIQNPVQWTGTAPNDDEKQHRFDKFAEAISARALAVAKRRLAQDRIPDWQRAFSKSGTGSTFVRATIIADDVYGQAAPVPAIAPTPDRNRFLHEIVDVVTAAAQECDVELR